MKDFVKISAQDSSYPGVYIWGFMQRNNFIPYYVGKSQSTIASRIQQHYNDITKPGSTYIRLNKAYMEGENPYYLDSKYPLMTSAPNRNKLPSWIYSSKCDNRDHFKDRIDYINNKAFFELKGISLDFKKTNHSISDIGVKIDDYLVDNMDKLYVVYSAYSSEEYFGFKKNHFYELLEAFTKYHLNGRTGSKSLSLNCMLNKIKESNISISITNRDSYKNIFKDDPSDTIFPGY